jgi:hypothetical protein
MENVGNQQTPRNPASHSGPSVEDEDGTGLRNMNLGRHVYIKQTEDIQNTGDIGFFPNIPKQLIHL